MAESLKEKPQTITGEIPRVAERVRMVVGITSAQTCLVLTGRLRSLRLAGFDVTLVSSPGELLTRTARVEGVRARPLAMRRGMAPLADLWSFVLLFWLLLRERPGITDFSTPKAGLLGNLAAWMLRVPHRVYTLRGLKLESSSGWKRWVLLQSEKLAAACAHVVLCNSDSLRTEATVLGIASARKLRVLGDGSSNGVDTERFAPGESSVRGELQIPEGAPVLGFVGRLTRDKGVPELLEAFEEILLLEPDCWLLLVGWFDAAEDALDMQWQAHISGHPRIRHTGFVADTAAYYRAMDVMVFPTLREGFPNAVLEAAASGVPVITTDATGARDAVVPEVTGLLIPPGNVGAIIEATWGLLQNPAKRVRMGVAGRKWAVERYSKERVLGLAVEFYLGLVGSKDQGSEDREQ
jgi:glycosyltransferase involved in cell wall biosynthesis